MSKNETGTYQLAKSIYFNSEVMEDSILNITGANIVRIFRKHLTEFEYRNKQGKQFTSKILDKSRVLVKRIK